MLRRMAIDHYKVLPDTSAATTVAVRRKAALMVCGHATDVDDAAELLDMLGLLSPDLLD